MGAAIADHGRGDEQQRPPGQGGGVVPFTVNFLLTAITPPVAHHHQGNVVIRPGEIGAPLPAGGIIPLRDLQAEGMKLNGRMDFRRVSLMAQVSSVIHPTGIRGRAR